MRSIVYRRSRVHVRLITHIYTRVESRAARPTSRARDLLPPDFFGQVCYLIIDSNWAIATAHYEKCKK